MMISVLSMTSPTMSQRLEEHTVDEKKVKVCVHRKGATRAFGPGCPDVPADYAHSGQPVLIPGSMGSSLFLLKGTDVAMRDIWFYLSWCRPCSLAIPGKRRSKGKTSGMNLGRQESLSGRPMTGYRRGGSECVKPSSEVVSVVHNLAYPGLLRGLNLLG